MKTFTTHQQRLAFVEALMDLFWRGYEGDPLDMAERAALDDATFAIYRMGQQQFLMDTV
ncbi:MAG: hypothetical protein ABFE08_19370 [Armatimonadia bacterium]